VEIRTLDTAIGGGTAPLSNILADETFDIPLSNPASVFFGRKYALLFIPIDCNAIIPSASFVRGGTGYSGGDLWTSFDFFSELWTKTEAPDVNFRTFVC
jgi:hypothetical protein